MATNAELVGLLRSSYPNANVGPETVRAFVQMLSDVSPEELEPVVLRHVATSPRFPSIAELRGAIVERRQDLPEPDEAWFRVAVLLIPIADLTAPEREAVEHVGGRYAIKTSERPDVQRAQFLKAYEAKRRRALERENLGSLAEGPRALAAGARD